jgi:hypothetical protein
VPRFERGVTKKGRAKKGMLFLTPPTSPTSVYFPPPSSIFQLLLPQLIPVTKPIKLKFESKKSFPQFIF